MALDALAALETFQLDEVLSEEPDKHRMTLLGRLPASWPEITSKFQSSERLPREAGETQVVSQQRESLRAIVRIEKTAFSTQSIQQFFRGSLLEKVSLTESTDIYSWLAGWLHSSDEKQPQGDVKINIVCPATDVHIRKYSKQDSVIVRETPFLYDKIVKPYIDSFPPSRTKWVTDILDGRSEQEKILFSSADFVILPDMKWDLHTVSSLYLVAISRDNSLRTLRDLTRNHIPLLKTIRREAHRVTQERWGLGVGSLRMWIHYQPSYYHFHVHIANAGYEGAGMGMAVGQAHLLDDAISLLELDSGSPGIFQKMTLTYGLGDQHGLYIGMKLEHESLD